MLKRNWIEDLDSWNGFTYIRLKGVPMKRSKDGGIIDFNSEKLARLTSERILESRTPIRGKELKLLRSVTGLSLNRFAHRMGLSYGAIFHWEKNEKQRLSPVNEIAVRLLCAEELGVTLKTRFSDLLGSAEFSAIEVTVTSRKPTPKVQQERVTTRPSYRGHRKVITQAQLA